MEHNIDNNLNLYFNNKYNYRKNYNYKIYDVVLYDDICIKIFNLLEDNKDNLSININYQSITYKKKKYNIPKYEESVKLIYNDNNILITTLSQNKLHFHGFMLSMYKDNIYSNIIFFDFCINFENKNINSNNNNNSNVEKENKKNDKEGIISNKYISKLLKLIKCNN